MYESGQNGYVSIDNTKRKVIAYRKYISYLLLSLALTTLGAYCGSYLISSLSRTFLLIYCFVSIGLMLGFMFSRGAVKKILFYAFTFGEGITLAPLLSILTTASLYRCLFATTLIVASFAILGLKFKDLSFLGGILFALLLSILGLSILSIFVPLPFLAYLGLGVFCLYLMYDINSFKLSVSRNEFIDDNFILNEVMNVYLDILNILMYVLRIISDNDN
ncbi:Bax inhibitor-1 family protein [Clostridium sp.]|uniref:Bax inhibitor-1 family protein n=1 Tax=Clostridium sp. TaxID=1506 RepID=UPI00284F5BC2|nr:Bax inhibitor-1 family protein [Clostridium sp.]MDR3596990.1 Bax inhibitor-1 family protein [Clostridium sp.]